MRPHKLVISAFGPYPDKTEVNFDKLNQGLFLISGDTGSGKTTIFDAISFALYGEPSGDMRNSSMLRCIFAKPTTPTFVELTFEYQNQEYYIKRTPRYMRQKISGEGETEQIHEAEIKLPTGQVISGVSQVDEKIIEILKIDVKQFSQIVMIAQNDFLKLLKSNTNERKEILRMIFSTEIYLDFEKKLTLEAKMKKTDYDKLIDLFNYNVTSIQVSEEINFLDIQDYYYSKELIKSRVNSLLNKDKEEIVKLTDQISKDKNELSGFEKTYTLASISNKAFKDLEVAKSNLKDLSLQESTIEKNKNDLKLIKIIQKDIIEVDNQNQNLLKRQGEIKQALIEIDKEIENSSKALKDSEVMVLKIPAYEKSISDLNNDITTITNQLPKYTELNNNVLTLKELEEKLYTSKDFLLKEVLSSYQNYEKNQKLFEDKLVQYNNFKESYIKLREEYEESEKIYLQSQAAILASNLKVNQPCPVCGSTKHPQIAKLSDDALSEAEFSDLKTRYLTREKDYEERRNKILLGQENLNKNKVNLDQMMTKIFDQLVDKDYIENAIQKNSQLISNKKINISNDFNALLTLVKDYKVKIVSLKVLVNNLKADLKFESIDSANIKLKALEADVEKYRQFINATNKHHQQVKSKIEKQKGLKEERLKMATNLADEIKITSNKFNALVNVNFTSLDHYQSSKKLLVSIDEIEKIINKYNEDLFKNTTEKNRLEVELKDKKLVNLLLLEENINKLNKEIGLAEELRNKINNRFNTNEKLFNEVKKLDAKIQVIEKDLADIKVLSDTAKGSLTGKEKIQFETYAQMAYFNQILKYANKRLATMSNNQYELIRRETAINRSAQSGLEIDVFDHHHGKSRQVASLSGGESFNAALALALGLSDVIQHVSGGIQIDALFIDEGFGSLSDNHLDAAINTLAEIADSNRMIGVISHVKELKDRIDQQIYISKDRSGSSIKIITQ